MKQLLSMSTIIQEPLLHLAMRRAGAKRNMAYTFVLEKGLGERIEVTLLPINTIKLSFYPNKGGMR